MGEGCPTATKVGDIVLGRTRVEGSCPPGESWWWNAEVEGVIRTKTGAYHRWQEERNRDNWIEYRRARIEAKAKAAIAKYQKFPLRRRMARCSLAEIQQALKAMRLKSAVGPDCLPAEGWKMLGK